MISIIIPFKYDSENRLENILELLKYSKKHWRFKDIFLVEMDDKPKIVNLIPDWCKYIFAKECKEVWSRSKRINLAMHMVETDITMILDSDVIVDWDIIEYVSEKIINGELDASTPFEKLYHLSRTSIIDEMKKGKIKIEEYIKKNEASRIFETNGACFLTKTSVLKHIRGMSELFLGWGLEDDELISRYIKLGYKYGRIKGSNAIHINHERTSNCAPDPEYFLGSVTEKNRSLVSTKEEIMKYYGITNDVGLYNCLLEPLAADSDSLKSLVDKELSLYRVSSKAGYTV